ncbi:MAG: small ribosomal subunit biogenesis GTPase RsgA [Gammaproteobacteria bacterium]
MKNKKTSHKRPAKLHGNEREGLLVTTFGANAELEDDNGNLVRCHIRKNCDPVITGDRVLWLPEQDGTASIVGHLPRKSLLCRPENSHKLKPIAANIDAIIVATAPPPVMSENMIDRYLVAAENLAIQPIILLNKVDLVTAESKQHIEQSLEVYKKIGYTVIFSSVYAQNGLAELSAFLQDKTCVLIGPSGVGKSSIIAALTSEQSIKIGEVSASTGLGKHTTTTTRLYHLPHGGNLIDSPGVREFGLWNIDPSDVIKGFVEFKSLLTRCKFRDCKHQKEPGCAVQAAVANQEVSGRRFQNYQNILQDLAKRNVH